MPVFHDGVIYMSRGYRSGPYMAIRPGGRGDVTKTHIVWESQTGAPYISSLVHDAGLIYMATDVGGVTVVDAKTGARVWQQRIDGIFSASPVAGDGKVYFVSETGETIVLQAGRTPEVIARNDVGERADGVAGDLERADLPPHRRSAVRDRRAALARLCAKVHRQDARAQLEGDSRYAAVHSRHSTEERKLGINLRALPSVMAAWSAAGKPSFATTSSVSRT